MLRLEIGLWRMVALSVVAATAIGIWQRPGLWNWVNRCDRGTFQAGAMHHAAIQSRLEQGAQILRISTEGPIMVVEAEVAEQALRFNRPFVGGFFAEPAGRGIKITQVYGHEASPGVLSLVNEALAKAVVDVPSDDLPKIVEVRLVSGFSEPMLHCRAKRSCGSHLP